MLIFENEEKVKDKDKDKDKICCPSFGWSMERICKSFLHPGFVFHEEIPGADQYFSDNITSRVCFLLVRPKIRNKFKMFSTVSHRVNVRKVEDLPEKWNFKV